MARYVTVQDSLFQDSFINIHDAQNFAVDNFGAKLVDGLLCDKLGSRKTLKDIFKDNGFELEPLKTFIDQHGILETDIVDVHIEDGQLVVTLKEGKQNKIKY